MVRTRFGSLGVQAGLAAIALALAWAPPAHAFCRSMSCELGKKQSELWKCAHDQHQCVTEGQPLHWGEPCLQYAVQGDGSPKSKLSRDDFAKLVAQAFAAWEGVSCPGGGSPRFHAQFQGYVSCAQHETVCGGVDQNVNVMMLHDSGWPGLQTEIGLTSPTGGLKSGLVIDADLELNSQDWEFAPDAMGPKALDITQVLAHEVGHFLGLGHSDAPGALMSTDYTSLQTSRELLIDDDIAAICAVYPPGAPLDCPLPAPPAYDECQVKPGPQPECLISSAPQGSMTHDQHSGCSIAAIGAQNSNGWLAVIFGALGAGSLRRKRRPTTVRAGASGG